MGSCPRKEGDSICLERGHPECPRDAEFISPKGAGGRCQKDGESGRQFPSSETIFVTAENDDDHVEQLHLHTDKDRMGTLNKAAGLWVKIFSFSLGLSNKNNFLKCNPKQNTKTKKNPARALIILIKLEEEREGEKKRRKGRKEAAHFKMRKQIQTEDSQKDQSE